MSKIEVRLLGRAEIRFQDRKLETFPTSKSCALLAMLILRSNSIVHRDVLMGTLWGNRKQENARKSLNTELWRVRKLLKSLGTNPDDYVVSANDGVGFNGQSAFWLDVDEFNLRTRRIRDENPGTLTANDRLGLRQAVELYRGDLLEGHYEEWCSLPRESLRNRYISALELLLNSHRTEARYDDAIHLAEKLLTMDSLLEHAHRALMLCHYLKGNRPAAIRQYRRCEEALHQELGVDPMPQTKKVYELIASDAPNTMLINV